jgi:ubiquinone/menaquinone biosynthesis C-methylase UbiE
MLDRILEPEVMDSAEEAQDYDAMDHSQVNRAFVTDFLKHYAGAGPVLDVGTGTAHIPIELCRQQPVVTVVAVDAAAAMITLAETNVARAGLTARIALRLVDAKRLPHAHGFFPAIMSNSIVHHIPEPPAVLAEIVRVAAPGAVVFVRDLLRPASNAAVNALVDQYAAEGNSRQRKLFGDSLRAALTLEEMRALIAELGIDRETVQQTTDRHWTWAYRKVDL